MSANFDWQTEEEHDWEVDEQADVEPPVPGRRPWRFVALLLVVLAAAGAIVYRQAAQRIYAVTEEVKADVLSSHRLFLFAAVQKDVELASPLLSGRDPQWTEAQRQLVGRGLFVDRSVFGLELPPTDPVPVPGSGQDRDNVAAADITLAPDFRSAEVLYEQDYLVQSDQPGAGTVTLQQTAVYRQGSQRWLLSPPEREFWGDRDSVRGDILTVSFPARDRTVARRLADDLDVALSGMCRRLPGIDCPADLSVHLRLDTEPVSLVAAADPATSLNGSLRLSLPSPTLVGMPLDEAGYAALQRGYAVQVISAVITNLVAWQCCEQAPIFQALLDYQLSQLELRRWPIATADHQRVLDGAISLVILRAPWWSTTFMPADEPDRLPLYLAIDFLLHHFPSLTASDMQRALAQHNTLLSWLSALSADNSPLGTGSYLVSQLDREWWLYAYSQTLASSEPPPLPLPAEDIQLLCLTEVPELEMTLYRYRSDVQVWQEELTFPGFIFMNPLPDGETLVLQTIAPVGEVTQAQTQLWRNSAGTILPLGEAIAPEDGIAISFGQSDAAGRRLVANTLHFESNSEQSMVIDLNDCDAGACRSWLLPGPLVWSPSGSQALIVENASFFSTPFVMDGRVSLFDTAPSAQSWTLLRQVPGSTGDSESDFVEVGQGYAPFWLDDTTYGFIRVTGGGSQELVVASTADDVPRSLLNSTALREVIFSGSSSPAVVILYAVAHPTNPDLLFIVAINPQLNRGYVVSFDRQTGKSELRLETRLEINHMLSFSPDGRWLVVTGSGDEILSGSALTAALHVHDINHSQTKTYYIDGSAFSPFNAVFDWSADSQWLLHIMDSGILNLVAPEHDYQQLLRHDFGTCSSLAWVKP